MGNRNSKSTLRNAITILNISADQIKLNDDKFWSQIWSEDANIAADVIKNVTVQEIRMLRDGSPKNFACLAYKMVEIFDLATGTICNTCSQQTAILNATRILTRIIPCMFEDRAWSNFFIDNKILRGSKETRLDGDGLKFRRKNSLEKDYLSYLPIEIRIGQSEDNHDEGQVTSNLNELHIESRNRSQVNLIKLDSGGSHEDSTDGDLVAAQDSPLDDCHERTQGSLMKVLTSCICDLLFCPEFTVSPLRDSYLSNRVDGPPEDLKSLNTCDYVWEPGVGFDQNCNSTTYYDKSRSALLRLLLTCISSSLYETPANSVTQRNRWIEVLVSPENRHALPLFTSLLNTVFIYKPVGVSLLPINSILFDDPRPELVELSIEILIALLDYYGQDASEAGNDKVNDDCRNSFISYLSRIHREEDFSFLIQGFVRLLNQKIIASSRARFEQELLILFWKLSNHNKKFVTHLLKSKDALDIVLRIINLLNQNYQNPSESALTHIGVFNLLVLSGERNFGIILNKPYTQKLLQELPEFTGSYADLMIIVFHKLILYGRSLNQLYDYLLTIIVNTSPYLKKLTMLSSRCLIQLFEVFSSSFVVFTEPNYHELIVFLLDVFNNLIEYQFDGNANLVYLIMTKKHLFQNLANLPTSSQKIQKVIKKLIKTRRLNETLLEPGEQKPPDRGMALEGSKRNDNGERNSETSRMESKMDSSPDLGCQDVLLVATPSIHDVTHAIFPFNSNPIPEPKSTNQQPPRISPPTDKTSQSHSLLEDLLQDEPATIEQPPSSEAREPSEIPMDKIVGAKTTEDIEEPGGYTNTVTKLGGWSPTPEWAQRWKRSLPLHTILRMVEVLEPQIAQFQRDHPSLPPKDLEMETIKFLQKGTLVGLLPVPHQILIRKYRSNRETTLWFRVCSWMTIVARNNIWQSTQTRLIKMTA